MIPKKLGRFDILREIGKGAMGQVFLAHDPKIDRQVAIKTIVLPQGVSDTEAHETSQRFLREAQAAGRLLHPNIVTIFDIGEENGISFIAMEYIDGETLDRYARPDSLLPPGRVLDLMTQAASALDSAHEAKVIHRDIKPANLMMLRDGTLKVTDFGLAKNPTANLTQSGVLMGTPTYMSPEQIQGKELDGRSDLFSLGVVLYELLTGVRPFDADSISTIIYRVLYEDPRPPAAQNPALPPDVNGVIEKALHKDPDRRYATGAAFIGGLRRAFAMLPPDSLSRPFPGTTAPMRAAAIAAGAAAQIAAQGTASGARPRTPADAVSPTRPTRQVSLPPIGSQVARDARARSGALRSRAPAAAPPVPSTLIAHHPVKLAAVVVTLVAGLVVFPRWVDRAERLQSHRHSAAFERGAALAGGATQGAPAETASVAGTGSQDPADPAARVSVDVETRPRGGSVLLDDIPLATPRVVLARSDTNTHAIRARSGCLEAATETTAAELATHTGPITLDLKPRKETVAVGSDPAGARVRLNGRDIGKPTPVSIEMDTCEERKVELALDGRRPWSQTFAVGQGGEDVTRALQSVALQPIPTGTVTIPKPKGYSVEVYAGDRRVGRAGEPISLLEGRHTLTLRNDKLFVRETTQVSVVGDRGASPEIVFPPLGALTVQAQPSNCKVYVDGDFVDVTPVLDLPIAAGAHRVKILFVPNGATRDLNVSIGAGKTERVVVKF
ncbi:MAG TPA: serine/threonine-protein kinase [Patescibacteria group bacterium]|nr:serine/threonine-protein kinase [Patescibacteria group bacterium]